MNLRQIESLRFLVDVNLPQRFQYFNSEQFQHVGDIDPFMTDNEIWNYAIANNLILLTKDTDFYDLFLISDNYPKVIHFKFGNLTLKAMHQYFIEFWPRITEKLPIASFIVAYKDRIVVIR
jgi:predicted nuclease of predicted toxin-antitoxin system